MLKNWIEILARDVWRLDPFGRDWFFFLQNRSSKKFLIHRTCRKFEEVREYDNHRIRNGIVIWFHDFQKSSPYLFIENFWKRNFLRIDFRIEFEFINSILKV